ncbi:MAG: hypothetical protein LBU27_00635 [Candidatus Peribacteria bacterium]|jgi:hypothetical protein|nr:hypothetical protein [Candidatus Peribacteria bacterium]
MEEPTKSSTFNTVYHELRLLKNSKLALAALSAEIETILRAEGISGDVKKEHHLTLNYQKNVSAAAVIHTLQFLDMIRKSIANLEHINPNEKSDQTFHHVDARESFVDQEVYIVLQPHNEDSIYKALMKDERNIPHITLAKVNCSLKVAKKQLVPKIRHFLKSHIVHQAIVVDISEIITHTK